MDLNEQYLSLSIDPPPVSSADWNENGYVIRKKFLPEDLMLAYEECWLKNNAMLLDNGETEFTRPGGWPDCTPYRRHPELLDILSFKGIHDQIEELIGEPGGVHLNLTGWVSTTRNWHQDTYLNPPHVGDFYVAIWIALADIHPDSGPFQLVPGSHRWPVVTQGKILAALEPELRNHMWPRYSEKLLTPIFEDQIERRNAEVLTYLPERGDVLFWHGRLVHRGSSPSLVGKERRSLIAHYSGINHRSDMPKAEKYKDGWFFPIDDRTQGM